MIENKTFVDVNRDEILRKLALDMLATQAPPVSTAIYAAAIPRYFNTQVLAVILSVPYDRADNLNQELQRLPFIQPYGQSNYTVYDAIRAGILQEWCKPNHKSEYLNINNRLAQYYHEICDSDPISSRGERTEAIYHQIVVDEKNGFL